MLIEFRGLGLKSDTPEERAERVRDHNTIWGPFGRNLHEDLLGVHGQGRAMRAGTRAALGDPRPRREHDHPRRGRHAPLLRRVGPAAWGARHTIRSANADHGAASPARAGGVRRTSRCSRRERTIEELVYRSCLALDEQELQGLISTCATPSFRYSITAYSPEIRKEMIWLDHDKAGMKTLFTNLPRHNSDHSPLTRHATVYTVSSTRAGSRPRWSRRCRCSAPRSTAARRSCSRSVAMCDTVKLGGARRSCSSAWSNWTRASSVSAITSRSEQRRAMRIQINARNRAYQFETQTGGACCTAASLPASICPTSAEPAPAAPARRSSSPARSTTHGREAAGRKYLKHAG